MTFGIKSCSQVTQLVSQGLDRELDGGERLALRVHFMICRGCRNVNAQFGLLRQAVRALREQEA